MLWGLRPVELQSAYGLAVEVLRRQIHLGHLAPGERLPAERALAEQLTVSRVTLREALRVLEAEGYIVVRRGAQGGAFVNAVDALQEVTARRIGRDPGMVMRILEFRSATEPVAARLAATRRTPTNLAALGAALKAIRRGENAAKVRHAETMFHLAIGEASQNPMLAKAIEEARSCLFLTWPDEVNGADSRMPPLREHLFEAVRERKGAKAEEVAHDLLALDQARFQVLARIA